MLSLQSYAGTGPNFADKFFLRVQLLDGDRRVLDSFDSGEIVCAEGGEWRTCEHKFNCTDTAEQLRFIVWEVTPNHRMLGSAFSVSYGE